MNRTRRIVTVLQGVAAAVVLVGSSVKGMWISAVMALCVMGADLTIWMLLGENENWRDHVEFLTEQEDSRA